MLAFRKTADLVHKFDLTEMENFYNKKCQSPNSKSKGNSLLVLQETLLDLWDILYSRM